ncbi:olfactory receptor 4X1-like [Muntiacus reevesi]|uniref:olfactory receptor 4X1-like n=1 Tax=Muntiacus reevesi TaxID=9886 RepID=UPI003306B4D2
MAATSDVTEIIFLGFSQNRDAQKVISVLFLLSCVAILPGNGLIAVTIQAGQGLTSPVDLFLSYLSLTAAWPSASPALPGLVDPRLCGLLRGGLGGGLGARSGEPPHLPAALVWPGAPDRCGCGVRPLLKPACSAAVLGGALTVAKAAPSRGQLPGLLASCVVPPRALRARAPGGRRQALSPRASLRAAVALFFVPRSSVYERPCVTLPVDETIAGFYAVGTPLFSPVLYSFRNAVVKNALRTPMRRQGSGEEKQMAPSGKNGGQGIRNWGTAISLSAFN